MRSYLSIFSLSYLFSIILIMIGESFFNRPGSLIIIICLLFLLIMLTFLHIKLNPYIKIVWVTISLCIITWGLFDWIGLISVSVMVWLGILIYLFASEQLKQKLLFTLGVLFKITVFTLTFYLVYFSIRESDIIGVAFGLFIALGTIYFVLRDKKQN
ncbi:hypothetical protein EDC24_1338 [Aquisalibacillus elongatus]|uniref:Uncharacterized protein n=1 Tax=Aquisalibacillus elongatus TaxID=485577 RepID=A0A3N5BWL8_9BACI|nr:hypothetical protein EDC24_1338 [Aquisalibacillus elongatus]